MLRFPATLLASARFRRRHVYSWQIMLKNSFLGDERNFLGPLMRSARDCHSAFAESHRSPRSRPESSCESPANRWCCPRIGRQHHRASGAIHKRWSAKATEGVAAHRYLGYKGRIAEQPPTKERTVRACTTIVPPPDGPRNTARDDHALAAGNRHLPTPLPDQEH
jgi:hypothetical protein